MNEFSELQVLLREFAAKRDWLRFHDPKNLAMAISSEAGELVAELRWLSTEESDPSQIQSEKLKAIKYELADVLIFLIRLGDVLEIDLPQAVRDKIDMNHTRFPENFGDNGNTG